MKEQLINIIQHHQLNTYISTIDAKHEHSVIEIDCEKCLNEDMLYTELKKKLRFPNYFGWNWDALDECMRDLMWFDEEYIIVVWNNPERLLEQDEEGREIFLHMVFSIEKEWQNGEYDKDDCGDCENEYKCDSCEFFFKPTKFYSLFVCQEVDAYKQKMEEAIQSYENFL